MDAREALRLYLEQRRELGETELVLDSLSVEEAMKLLGASTSGGKHTRADSGVAERADLRPHGMRHDADPYSQGWAAVPLLHRDRCAET